MRFMHDHGVSQEALAEVALACYAHAQRNPRAIRYGQPLTREAYHASRWIAEPFHLYDCCPENDGAAAIVVTTPERARDLAKPPVAIVAGAHGLGAGDGAAAFTDRNFPTAFYREVAEQLWARAGCRPADVQVAQFYENFTGPGADGHRRDGLLRARGARRVRRRRQHPVARRSAADQHVRRQPRRGVHPRLRQRGRGGPPGARRVHLPGRRRRAQPVGVRSGVRAGQRRAVRQGVTDERWRTARRLGAARRHRPRPRLVHQRRAEPPGVRLVRRRATPAGGGLPCLRLDLVHHARRRAHGRGAQLHDRPSPGAPVAGGVGAVRGRARGARRTARRPGGRQPARCARSTRCASAWRCTPRSPSGSPTTARCCDCRSGSGAVPGSSVAATDRTDAKGSS